ncbi:hypothetical protein D3C86_1177610 [compost metagenome]
MDEARWWPLDEALKVLTYKSERETVERGAEMIRELGAMPLGDMPADEAEPPATPDPAKRIP